MSASPAFDAGITRAPVAHAKPRSALRQVKTGLRRQMGCRVDVVSLHGIDTASGVVAFPAVYSFRYGRRLSQPRPSQPRPGGRI